MDADLEMEVFIVNAIMSLGGDFYCQASLLKKTMQPIKPGKSIRFHLVTGLQ